MQSLYREGYVVVPGLLGDEQVRLLLHAINRNLGDFGMDPGQLAAYQHDSYCPALRDDPVLIDLFDGGGVFEAAERLVGHGNLLPVNRIQVALRFPTRPGTPIQEPRGHIDGLGTGVNGIPKGTYRRSFTVLCVVLLSDLPQLNMGNFTVFPGSHRLAEAHFKQHGHEGLHSGSLDIEGLEAAEQIMGKPGDVLFAHHMLLHCGAVNFSPFVRYAIILRFRHKGCGDFAERAFTDMWREWEGLFPAGASASGTGH